MEILTPFLLYVIRLGISYSTLKSFSQYSNFQMFSNDIFRARIDTKSVTEKTVKNLNLNFKFFVQREVWVMGSQELCLLCYET